MTTQTEDVGTINEGRELIPLLEERLVAFCSNQQAGCDAVAYGHSAGATVMANVMHNHGWTNKKGKLLCPTCSETAARNS